MVANGMVFTAFVWEKDAMHGVRERKRVLVEALLELSAENRVACNFFLRTANENMSIHRRTQFEHLAGTMESDARARAIPSQVKGLLTWTFSCDLLILICVRCLPARQRFSRATCQLHSPLKWLRGFRLQRSDWREMTPSCSIPAHPSLAFDRCPRPVALSGEHGPAAKAQPLPFAPSIEPPSSQAEDGMALLQAP